MYTWGDLNHFFEYNKKKKNYFHNSTLFLCVKSTKANFCTFSCNMAHVQAQRGKILSEIIVLSVSKNTTP